MRKEVGGGEGGKKRRRGGLCVLYLYRGAAERASEGCSKGKETLSGYIDSNPPLVPQPGWKCAASDALLQLITVLQFLKGLRFCLNGENFVG